MFEGFELRTEKGKKLVISGVNVSELFFDFLGFGIGECQQEAKEVSTEI